ncbi:MAG: hypothetical protein IT459_15700 [Planctomycetes bacterium]|nr:hypothetical protein [Planctomycetota bacterium]
MKWIAAFALSLAACASDRSTSPYLAPGEVARSTVEAEALSRKGADLIATDLVEAETVLREALAKDLFYGPAHNNLGVVFLKQQKLYEAASEFEWAKKLMPGHPDPRVNLAITLERAGRTSDALASYEAALQVSPDYLPAIQGLAVATVRSGARDERLRGWLDRVALESESETWREWAQSQSTRTGATR